VLARLPTVFRCLNDRRVRAVVIGGVAAIVHGVPRTTFDLDLLVEATVENVSRLLDALRDAGIGSAELTTPEALLAHEITVFKDVMRIDVQTRTRGVEFASAWADRVERRGDGVPDWLVSRDHLIAMKRSAGHPKDLGDLRVLLQQPED